MLTNTAQQAHYPIDPERLDLAREFRCTPRGHYSLELQLVLYRMRWSGAGLRHVLLTMEPGKRWMLAQLPARRGEPLKTFPDRLFDSLADAEWAVFCLRWEALTGRSLSNLNLD